MHAPADQCETGSHEESPMACSGERALFYGVGGALLLAALGRRSLLIGALGGTLIYLGSGGQIGGEEHEEAGRGPSFHGENESSQWVRQRPTDQVEEASMESFPASDPPARGVDRV